MEGAPETRRRAATGDAELRTLKEVWEGIDAGDAIKTHRAIKVLSDSGVQVDVPRKSDGVSPLFLAASLGHTAMCKQLLQVSARRANLL